MSCPSWLTMYLTRTSSKCSTDKSYTILVFLEVKPQHLLSDDDSWLIHWLGNVWLKCFQKKKDGTKVVVVEARAKQQNHVEINLLDSRFRQWFQFQPSFLIPFIISGKKYYQNALRFLCHYDSRHADMFYW